MRVRLVDADYERTRKLRWLRTNTTTGTSPRVVQPYNRVPPLLFLFLFLLSFPSARFFRWGFYERILRLDQPTSGNSSVDFFFPSFSLLSFFFLFFDLWETFGNRIFVRVTYIYTGESFYGTRRLNYYFIFSCCRSFRRIDETILMESGRIIIRS